MQMLLLRITKSTINDIKKSISRYLWKNNEKNKLQILKKQCNCQFPKGVKTIGDLFEAETLISAAPG